MSWQTIAKENNLDVSIIPFNQLMERIDAEYYRPRFLSGERLIGNKQSTRLGDIADIKGGKRLPKGEAFSDNGIPYIRAEDVKNSFVEYENSPKISLELQKKLKSYQTKLDDVLITIVGNSIGDVGIVKFELEKCNLTENCAKLVNLKGINAEYLFSFLLSKYGQNQIEREQVGTSQPKLALVRIRDFKLPIPNHDLQEKISKIIRRAQQLKESSIQQYVEAERLLLKEINLEMYSPSDKNTSVRELAECLTDNRFDAEYWQVEFDAIQNTIRKNKDGFDTLDNLFEIEGEKIDIDLEKEYLYAELADVNGATGAIDNLTLLKGADLPSRGRMKLKRNDLIVSSVEGSLEKIALVSSDEENIVGSTGFFVLRAKEYEPEVALSLLKLIPIQKLLKRQAQGTILTAIPKSSLSRVLLPKINSPTQQKVKDMISRSHMENQEAKELLEKAKRAVEIFIEKDEQEALKYLAP